MSQNAGRNLERQWRENLSKVLDRQEKAKASLEDRLFPKDSMPAAPTGIRQIVA
jgi:hypothetical protein